MIICLISLSSQHAYVHSKVITINTTGGSDNTTCCVDGKCVCTSLSTALLNMTSNTIINITSESVTLEGHSKMGSGDLNNIAIIGNGVTIMCNNFGSVYCEYCNNVIIDGITWDKCGNPNGTSIHTAAVTFYTSSNISLYDCTFQHSLIIAVSFLKVSRKVLLKNCNFTSNGLIKMNSRLLSSLVITSSGSNGLDIVISECVIYDNGYWPEASLSSQTGLYIYLSDHYSMAKYYITISNCTISSKHGGAYIEIHKLSWISIAFEKVNVLSNLWDSKNVFPEGIAIKNNEEHLHHNHYGIQRVAITSSTFSGNMGSSLVCYLGGVHAELIVLNSNFTDNKKSNAVVNVVSVASKTHIKFSNLSIVSNINMYPNREEIISIENQYGDIEISLIHMKVNSNNLSSSYNDEEGGIIAVKCKSTGKFQLIVDYCEFTDNSYSIGSAVLTINLPLTNPRNKSVQILNTCFHQNFGGNRIVLITAANLMKIHGAFKPKIFLPNVYLKIKNSNFTNNIGSALYISNCYFELQGTVRFINNTADNGAAIYMKEYSVGYLENVTFAHNSALQYGGAIYVDYTYTSFHNGKSDSAYMVFINATNNCINFTNNHAVIAGNSLYINIPKYMEIESDFTNGTSIMHVPCQWSYYQLVNGKLTKISCDYDYTSLNDTLFPLVTSPHELRLYFLTNDGVHISSNSYRNTYFIANNILGHKITFKGAVFDYFGKPAESTQFSVQCTDCSTFTLESNHLFVNNITFISVSITTGSDIKGKNVNVTLDIVSLATSVLDVTVTLVIELQPCISHPGYVYSNISYTCVCYDHNIINCYDTYNEIKRGYWFGSVIGIPTTSLCPNHYCNFINRKETRQGYFKLPMNVDDQCEYHRTGIACGECRSGYTLAYYSTDCISVEHCSVGMTVLVIVLTCLYWIAVVIGIFSLMYFNFQLSSGYLYGVIYYYSMVGILLDNNPYISDGVLQFVSVLSSFSQLNLKFLQQFCFIKGLSGIDQLFIQYVHAVAVALLTVLIVIAARCSARVALFIRKCILQVMCLLILLSYTSLASTSLQLLRPIKFTGSNKVYTYTSPSIGYFHGRHTLYGIVAAICVLVVVIGLPLFLLLERFISRKIVIKVMPLLDHFQSCFKLKYRWFAAYYLICRQVIMLIVFVGNINYYNMLFYLQTACIIIAMIHIGIQPYQDDSLNALDGLILLIMVLVVNLNTFPFLQSITAEISIILISLPLILLCFMIIRNKIYVCVQNCHYHRDEYDYDFEEEEQLLNDYNNALR